MNMVYSPSISVLFDFFQQYFSFGFLWFMFCLVAVIFLWFLLNIYVDFYVLLFNTAFLFCYFFLLFNMFVLFALLYSSYDTLFWSCFQFCALISFVFNWLILFPVSFACWVTLLYFPLVCFGSCVCTSVCLFLCFCFNLSDFTFTICLRSTFCFFFGCLFAFCLSVLIPFIVITNSLHGLGSLSRSRAWASGVGTVSAGQ